MEHNIVNGILIRKWVVYFGREKAAECGVEKRWLRRSFPVFNLENYVHYATINWNRKWGITG